MTDENLIGKVSATKKQPTTVDEFYFRLQDETKVYDALFIYPTGLLGNLFTSFHAETGEKLLIYWHNICL